MEINKKENVNEIRIQEERAVSVTMRLLAVFVIIALSMWGCVPVSLNPLYSDKDVIFESGLVGTWYDKEDNESIAFQKSGENSYDVCFIEDGERGGKFEVHLLRLGEFLFLDFYPGEPDIEDEFYKWHLMPMHSFFRVSIERDNLRLAMFNLDWLSDMIEQKKVDIKHELSDDRVILTAPTQELQEFVLKYIDEAFESLYGDDNLFHRRK